MNLEHATPELFTALAKSQNEVENASKASINPHFKSRYADLAEVINCIRPVYSANGLSIIQETSYDGSMVSVTTALCHNAGGYITMKASCIPAKSDAQGVGSSTTYLRRYSLAGLGIAQEDDDGQSASHSGKPIPTSVKAKPNTKAATKEQIAEISSKAFDLNVDIEAFETFIGSKLSEMTEATYSNAKLALDAKARKLIAPIQ
jgi:hypothetical protein